MSDYPPFDDPDVPDVPARRATDAAYAAERAAARHRDVLLLDELTTLRDAAFPPDADDHPGTDHVYALEHLLDRLNLRITELTRDLEDL